MALESQATNTGYIGMFTERIQVTNIVEAGGEEKKPVSTCLLNSYTELPQKLKVKVDRKIGHKPH